MVLPSSFLSPHNIPYMNKDIVTSKTYRNSHHAVSKEKEIQQRWV